MKKALSIIVIISMLATLMPATLAADTAEQAGTYNVEITDIELLSTDYEYLADVGSGLVAVSGATITFEDASERLPAFEAEILAYINAGDATNIFDRVYEMLGSYLNMESKPVCGNEDLYAIKNDDFGGSFCSILQVEQALEIANKIYAIKNANLELLATAIKDGADAIGFDTSNYDYATYTDAFLTMFAEKIVKYNVITKLNAVTCFGETAALTAINNRNIELKAQVFSVYQQELNISSALLKKINSVSAEKVARVMADFTASEISEVLNKIESIVDMLATENNFDNVSSGGSGCSGGGSQEGGSNTPGDTNDPAEPGDPFEVLAPYGGYADTTTETNLAIFSNENSAPADVYLYDMEVASEKATVDAFATTDANTKTVLDANPGARWVCIGNNVFAWRPVTKSDGETEREAMFTTKYLRNRPSSAWVPGAVYFKATDIFTEDDNNVTFVVEYLDEGTADILIQYVNQAFTGSGVSISSVAIPRTDTGKWITTAVSVEDANIAVGLTKTALADNKQTINVYSNGVDTYISKFMVVKTSDYNKYLAGELEATDDVVVANAKSALNLNITETKENFALPTYDGVDISWASDNVAIVIDGDSAIVVRSAEDVVVTLTATITKGEISDTKSFDITVKAREIAESTNSAIKVASSKGRAGKTVEIPVIIQNNPGVAGVQLTLTYDSRLTLTSVAQSMGEEDSALESLNFNAPGDISQNPLTLSLDGLVADATNGKFLVLTFTLPEDATNSTVYEIQLSYNKGDIYDDKLEDLEVEIVNGSITVMNYTIGDVNDDDNINTKDITVLRRGVAGGFDVTLNQAADVNCDGIINTKDITVLRRYVAGGFGIVLDN